MNFLKFQHWDSEIVGPKISLETSLTITNVNPDAFFSNINVIHINILYLFADKSADSYKRNRKCSHGKHLKKHKI